MIDLGIVRCKDCLAWDHFGGESSFGHCRRYAPKPLMVPVNVIARDGKVASFFPVTEKAEGCWEGVPKALEKERELTND